MFVCTIVFFGRLLLCADSCLFIFFISHFSDIEVWWVFTSSMQLKCIILTTVIVVDITSPISWFVVVIAAGLVHKMSYIRVSVLYTFY